MCILRDRACNDRIKMCIIFLEKVPLRRVLHYFVDCPEKLWMMSWKQDYSCTSTHLTWKKCLVCTCYSLYILPHLLIRILFPWQQPMRWQVEVPFILVLQGWAWNVLFVLLLCWTSRYCFSCVILDSGASLPIFVRWNNSLLLKVIKWSTNIQYLKFEENWGSLRNFEDELLRVWQLQLFKLISQLIPLSLK